MKLYKIHKEILVKAQIDNVFEFFSKPENLQKLTPPNMKLQILTPLQLKMCKGSVFDYTVSVFGIPIHWTAFITDFSPPCHFIDTQLKGPYFYWHHTHSFQCQGAYTLITDNVLYAMPFGYIGTLAHTLFVKRQLENVFTYRENYLKKMWT